MHDAIGSFLRTSGLGARTGHLRVYRAWDDAAGSTVARRARPVRFERGELVVEVSSAACLQELSAFTGEGIRERANEALKETLGEPAIRRVTFRLKR